MLDQLSALIGPTAIRTSTPTPTATPASVPSPAGTAIPIGPTEPTPGLPGATPPTPASPVATPVGTPDVATPTATRVFATATPSPIAVVEADGYLLGLEHGLALAQTTRAESPTHQGWVDITLALAVVNIVPDTLDAPDFETQEESTSICLVSRAPPEDCITVAWGSAEQHRADLRLSRVADAAQRPRQNVWPLSVIFELPANAGRASLRYGDYRLPLNLEGDAPFVPNSPAAVPVPVASPGAPPGTSAYFLGEDYGIAITGLTRGANDGLPGWATANLFLAVVRLADDRSFAPSIRIDTETGQTCFLGEDNDNRECPRIVWGPEGRFESAVRLSPGPEDSTLPWPRGMGWPISLTFDVPDRVQDALLVFGGHKISRALHGMAGSLPSYDYRLHYLKLETGSSLYANDNKLIKLDALVQRGIRFYAGGPGACRTGVVDGGNHGWYRRCRGWMEPCRDLRPGRHACAGPDAILLELAATDAGTDSGLRPSVSAFAAFDRSLRERSFWLPDLAIADIQWMPVVPAIGRDAIITITVENLDDNVDAGESNLSFLVDGKIIGVSRLPAIGAGESVEANFTWPAVGDADTFGASVDTDDEVEEDNDANNQSVVSFGGAAFPDLAIQNVTWSPRFPIVGDRVTFTVTVNNLGRGIAGEFRVYVYFDGGQDPRWNLPFPEMMAGQSATGTFSWTALDGFHFVQAVADGGKQVNEADESNNSATAGPTAVEGLPDLTVTGINWTPELPTVGQNVTVSASVKNRHPLIGANASALLFQVDGEDFAEVSVGALSPGESVTRSFTWKAEEGRHTFSAHVDPDDDLEETEEANNERRVIFGGAAFPDLVITGLSWSPNRPSVDSSVSFSVTVKNQGRVSAAGFRTYVYFDEETITRWDLSFPALSSGRGATRSFSWTAESGQHTFTVIADGLEEIPESDDTGNNNTGIVTLTVE